MSATLYLYRGLPGSGHVARAAEHGLPVRRMEDFPGLWTQEESVYGGVEWHYHGDKKVDYYTYPRLDDWVDARYPATLRTIARDWCRALAWKDLAAGRDTVVASSIPRGWVVHAYQALAQQMGATLVVVDVFDGGEANDFTLYERSKDGERWGYELVDRIGWLRSWWEHDWEKADPDTWRWA